MEGGSFGAAAVLDGRMLLLPPVEEKDGPSPHPSPIGRLSVSQIFFCWRWTMDRCEQARMKTPSTKLQAPGKPQAQSFKCAPLKIGVWSFPEAWSLKLGALPLCPSRSGWE